MSSEEVPFPLLRRFAVPPNASILAKWVVLMRLHSIKFTFVVLKTQMKDAGDEKNDPGEFTAIEVETRGLSKFAMRRNRNRCSCLNQ